eukprot:CAMPEP_0170519708 /NCGR_PEP_ID=MMETSP0209-20121228/5025_1 /TAXON_ID=665100 ORGANISM="Litonotus pictus, Strain P1" /NCGR_SAMPLE_ID=MMETSP0209 /ASSEMBLY_ACC=CAM_ASM_000301 /LENGTH=1697 /DNA_ID=CAMNT_0010805659 /DNA_START=60 /DNA_END=5153 /DNA_ORIENTATION=+
MKIPRASLLRFDRQEKKKQAEEIVDLRELEIKSESSAFSMLNLLSNQKQYFVYSGPLLLNINPGPNDKSYLNLEKWINNQKNNQLERENSDNHPVLGNSKPHIYSFINYVYRTLISENKSQTVNMLGSLASGKTFNLIHCLEYLCQIACNPYKLKSAETFDTIHKSVQLIHILGSIFRHNNLESTSCGIKVNIGFDNDNYISSFNLEADILDLTLPFSDSGRSFSILHAIVAGASTDVKKMLEFTEKEEDFVFFRKFYKTFDTQQQDRFKLNDLEIWNKFHSLLNYFLFTKQEVLDIIQVLSVVIIANELAVGKYTTQDNSKQETLFKIFKGPSSRKIAAKLGISEEEFLKKTDHFKSINQVKDFVSNLMKKCYQCVLEYIKNKIQAYLNIYFYCLNKDIDLGAYLESLGVIIRSSGNGGISNRNLKTTGNLTNVNNVITKVNNSSIQTIHAYTSQEETRSGNKGVSRKNTSQKGRSASLIANSNNRSNQSNFKINYAMNTNTSQNNNVQTINQTTQTSLIRNILDVNLTKNSMNRRASVKKVSNSKYNTNTNNDNSLFNNNKDIKKENKDTVKETIGEVKNETSQIEKNSERFICFIDFPGEIEDHTLGGFVTNTANECLNSYASSQYSSIYTKLSEEGIFIKYFQKLHANKVVHEILGENGFLNNMENLLQFPDSRESSKVIEWGKNNKNSVFKCNFSTNSVVYDLNVMKNEINSLVYNPATEAIFKQSENSIISWTMKKNPSKILCKKQTVQTIVRNLLNNFIKGLKGIHPFVVYCFHTKNSLRLFPDKNSYNNKEKEEYIEQSRVSMGKTVHTIKEEVVNTRENHRELVEQGNLLPYNQTTHLMRRSLVLSVLYWEWFGYHEWIKVELFNDMFFQDFLFIRDSISIFKIQNLKKFTKEFSQINSSKMSIYEKATCILSTFSDSTKYVMGQMHILCKKGVIGSISKQVEFMKNKYIEENNKRAAPQNVSGNKKYLPNKTSMSNYKKKNSGVGTSNTNLTNISNSTNVRNYNNTSGYSNQVNTKFSEGNQKLGILKNKDSKNINTEELGLNYNKSNDFTGNINNTLSKPTVTVEAEKRRSLKVQCHLSYIDSQQFKSPLQDEEHSNNNELFDLLEGNYQNTKKVISDLASHTKEWNDFKKSNNIIVPKQDFFDRVKRILSDERSYKYFSYEDCVDQIIMIQSLWKGFAVRMKYQTFKCVVHSVTKIQALVKGVQLRFKFKKYIQILYSAVFIQRMYKHRHQRRVESITYIQSFARVFLYRLRVMKFLNKVKTLKKMNLNLAAEKISGSVKDMTGNLSLIRGNSSISDKNLVNLVGRINISHMTDETLEDLTFETFNGIDNETKGLLNKLENLKEGKPGKKGKMNSPQKRNTGNLLTHKNSGNVTSGNSKTLTSENMKRLSSAQLVNMELSNLTGVENKNRIIDSLMNNMGNVVYSNHVNRAVRGSVSDYVISDISSMGLLKRSNNRVEDKLIEYGKNAKLKQEAAKYEKNKQFFDEHAYRPKFKAKPRKVSQGKVEGQPMERPNFYDRQSNHITKHLQNVEELKSEIKEPEIKELTFKPQISKFASSNFQKRTVDDLYSWQKKVEKEKKKKIEEKEVKEENEVQEAINKKHKISKNSEIILKSKHMNQSNMIGSSMMKVNNEKEFEDDEISLNKDEIKLDIENESRINQNILNVMNDNDFSREEELDLWPTKKLN